MLHSSGFSVRPRPLSPWLNQLRDPIPTSTEDCFISLNQLALIAYFNGDTALAHSICVLAMRASRANKEIRHFGIQPFVNIGRLKSSSWEDSQRYFLLPHYALGLLRPPEECVDVSWGEFRNDPIKYQFCWAVFLSEVAKANQKGNLSYDEVDRHLKQLPKPPVGFEFSMLELLAAARLNQESECQCDEPFYSILPKNLRQQVTRKYLDCRGFLKNNKKKEALRAALLGMYLIQQYDDAESFDPFLNLAFEFCTMICSSGSQEQGSALFYWLHEMSISLNHEPMTFLSLRAQGKEQEFNELVSCSEYKRFNPSALSLSDQIEGVKERVLVSLKEVANVPVAH